MATELSIFNGALAALGQRELVSLTDPVESRRVLQRLWDAGLPNACLEMGNWNFATRTVQSDDDPPAPAFGYTFRHAKPTDWLRTSKISTNDTFDPPLNQYSDEGGYWYANFDTLYIQFISSHPSYGGNIAKWPESFITYVEFYLAAKAAPRLLPLQEAQGLLKGPQGILAMVKMSLENAKSKDASNQPPEFPPLGTWARARSGNNFSISPDRDDD